MAFYYSSNDDLTNYLRRLKCHYMSVSKRYQGVSNKAAGWWFYCKVVNQTLHHFARTVAISPISFTTQSKVSNYIRDSLWTKTSTIVDFFRMFCKPFFA
jgi:hypothetical protein